MKILGFGDSFIMACEGRETYIDMVANHFSGSADARGMWGSSTWDAFFEYINSDEDADVVIFAWSNSSRLYHPENRHICIYGCEANKGSPDPIWFAANQYFKYLYSKEKTDYELLAFYYWFDNYLKDKKPNTKFINLWSFPKDVNGDYYDSIKNFPENLVYFHEWKNSVEIRPALIHFSMSDGWPESNDLKNEVRDNHMTRDIHVKLSKIIIRAIEEYEPGKIFKPL